MTTGHDILKRIEEHCGQKVENRRLRFHIACELDRHIEEANRIQGSIEAIFDGSKTYDPTTHKAIKRPKSERATHKE